MKIEKLKRFNVWKLIGIALIVCIICVIATFKVTQAKYKFTASYPAAYGTINWKVGDVSILAVNIEQDDGTYAESEDFPTDGYVLNTDESYCIVSVNGEQVKQDVTLSYEDNSLLISNITKKGTKCFLYFDNASSIKYAGGYPSEHDNLYSYSIDGGTTWISITSGETDLVLPVGAIVQSMGTQYYIQFYDETGVKLGSTSCASSYTYTISGLEKSYSYELLTSSCSSTDVSIVPKP